MRGQNYDSFKLPWYLKREKVKSYCSKLMSIVWTPRTYELPCVSVYGRGKINYVIKNICPQETNVWLKSLDQQSEPFSPIFVVH